MEAIAQPTEIDFPTEYVIPDLRWLVSAMCADSTRFMLGQVHRDGKDLVTTDGHRLHIVRGALFPRVSVRSEDARMLLDALRALDARGLTAEGQQVRLVGAAGTRVTIDLAPAPDGFPQYQQVIPKNWKHQLQMKASDLRKAQFEVSPGDWRTVITVDGLSVELNPAYVEDALRGAPKGALTVHLGEDDYSPVGFEYGNRLAIVMPMRKGAAK